MTTTSTPTPPPQVPKGTWFFPYREMQLADGSVMIKPLKPVLMMTAKQTAKYTGVSRKTLARLAESGYIRCATPTPHLPMYFPGEVMEFLQKTMDEPGFWTAKRRTEYGLARLVKK